MVTATTSITSPGSGTGFPITCTRSDTEVSCCVMFELDSNTDTAALLEAGGWTLLTAVSLALCFVVAHTWRLVSG